MNMLKFAAKLSPSRSPPRKKGRDTATRLDTVDPIELYDSDSENVVPMPAKARFSLLKLSPLRKKTPKPKQTDPSAAVPTPSPLPLKKPLADNFAGRLLHDLLPLFKDDLSFYESVYEWLESQENKTMSELTWQGQEGLFDESGPLCALETPCYYYTRGIAESHKALGIRASTFVSEVCSIGQSTNRLVLNAKKPGQPTSTKIRLHSIVLFIKVCRPTQHTSTLRALERWNENPGEFMVLHRCGNGLPLGPNKVTCCNSQHLVAGGKTMNNHHTSLHWLLREAIRVGDEESYTTLRDIFEKLLGYSLF